MFEDKIIEGIKYLDADDPTWPRKISLTNLQMWSGCWCIIGQLYEDYMDIFAPGDPTPYNLGFAVRGMNDSETDALYDVLTGEWKKKIIELRNERRIATTSP